MDKTNLIIKTQILSSLKPMIENPPCFSTIIDLDCSITNQSIIGIWNYYRITSKLFKKLYFRPRNNIPPEEFQVYSTYYNKLPVLKQLFDSHITMKEKKHVILFFNQNDASVIILYKPVFQKKNNTPFWLVEVDKSMINSDFIFSNMKLSSSQIKVNCYV